MKSIITDHVLDEIAQDNYSNIIDLVPSIQGRVEKEKKIRMKTTKLLVAIPTFALIFALIIATVPAATQAMHRLLGYLPELGLVDQSSPLRVLDEPVKSEKNGISITVEQAVLNAENTLILIQVENLVVPENPGEDVCLQLPVLRLPDGTVLEGTGTGSGWALGYNRRLTYPSIPTGVNEAVLVFPCLQQTPRSAALENWEIPLHFVLAPAGTTVYPLVDLPTSTAVPATATAPVLTEPVVKVVSSGDISLSFNSFIPMPDGNMLYGSLQPADATTYIDSIDPSGLHLVDSAGNEIRLDEEQALDYSSSPGANTFPLAYRTIGNLTPGPALFTIDSIWVSQAVSASFVFNPGSDPQAGQTWVLNQNVAVAGHNLRVASAMLDASGTGLTFTFDPASEIQSAVLTDFDHPLTGGAGGPGTFGFAFASGLPDQPILVSVTTISFELSGPWQTTLELPAPAATAALTPEPTALCLSRAAWDLAVNDHSASLPGGLTGRLAMSFMTESDFNYQVMVASLDSSDRRVIGYGDWPALSPGSSTLIYTGQEGLMIVDLATNRTTHVAGTTRRDRGALWSPDGKQIAFTRGPASGLIGAPGPYSIWVAGADGSNLHQVTNGSDANHAMAWLPGGDRILYTVEQANGASVRTIDIQNGDVIDLFKTNYNNMTVALSPDGKRVAFEEKLPGDRYAIYLSDLDGSNRRLLTDPSPVITTNPLWSPDGRWLAVSVWDPDSGSSLAILTLIRLDTCQIVPLPYLSSYGYTWNR